MDVALYTINDICQQLANHATSVSYLFKRISEIQTTESRKIAFIAVL